MRKSKRKLLSPTALAGLHKLKLTGVPTARLVADYDLDVSAAHLGKLIKLYDRLKHDPKIQDSLFPLWLNNNLMRIQEQPPEWKYNGWFPYGEWERR